MDIKEHTTPERLLHYAFMWSLIKMVIAAVSLFFGATPVLLRLSYQFGGLLTLAWLVSGVASLYLGYRWYKGGQTVFGGNDTKDTVAFLIMVVTGINLGITSMGPNIGMNLVSGFSFGDFIFKAAGIAYLLVAYHLWTRWNASGKHLV